MTPQSEADLEQLLVMLSELDASNDLSIRGTQRALLHEFVRNRLARPQDDLAVVMVPCAGIASPATA